ncbi:hypothetical protein [Pinirhizobacter soli]|uniref:hypothetical protein n=2 Tax=Pinirhizobacter soli TaxID=2786953 RepID=UPI00202A3497|nr:hypothetical protein [Pinirhizobacter soli]
MMKSISAKAAVAACMLVLAGCSATPTKPSQGAPGIVYDKPEATVQKAAVDALAANGFEILKSEPEYVEGSRPHKIGVVVGSGGESAGVWLSSLGSDKTSVKVNTAKSSFGIVGQKNWDKEIIAGMDNSLGGHQ